MMKAMMNHQWLNKHLMKYERGLLLYASEGTNDFNDIWNDDNQWMEIQDMRTWDGRDVKRKCLTIWKRDYVFVNS